MKKKILLFLALIFISYNALAYDYGVVYGDTKYEVTYLKVDKCGTDMCADIRGWAILTKNYAGSANQSGVLQTGSNGVNTFDQYGNMFNSGYCKYGSKPYRYANGNIVSGSGEMDEKYLYQYTLSVYDDENERLLGDSISNPDIIKFERRSISLTFLQAVKNKNIGRLGENNEGKTACYEDVGFKFIVNLSKLSKTAKFRFKLTISNGDGVAEGRSKGNGRDGIATSNKKSKTVDISVITTSGDDSLSTAIDVESLVDTVTTVKNFMGNGYTWDKPWGSKSSSYVIQPYQTFTVLERRISEDVGWYRIKVNGNSQRWIPASWTEPVASQATIVTVTEEETPDPTICAFKDITVQKQDKECEKCNDQVTMDSIEGKKCILSDTSTDFYSIACNEKIVSDFNPGNLSVKKGQGFYYGITVSSTKKCIGRFDAEKWKEAYNLALTKRNSSNSSADYNKYNNMLEELKNIVNSYNNYDMRDKNNPEASIEIEYKKKGGNAYLDYAFDKNITNNGEGNYVSRATLNLGDRDITNPSNFEYSNEANPRVIEFYPQKVYLAPITGEIVSETYSGGIDGGNKFYTDINSDTGDFTLTILVSNLGKKVKSTITNSKCVGTMSESTELYRIVETDNPFVNKNRLNSINNNWKNSKFDFTQSISNYSGNMYVFNLSRSNINEIKEDNKRDNNSYIGTCDKTTNKLSSAMESVCDTIKNSKNN